MSPPARASRPVDLDRPPADPVLVEVPERAYPMIDGNGGREEAQNIARLHAFIEDRGLRPRGRHHEIYPTDARRSAPDRMRTVLRQPVG